MCCKTCKFFKETGGVYGVCRRYPPTASMHGNAVFPTILCNMESCGEYKTKQTDETIKTARTRKGVI